MSFEVNNVLQVSQKFGNVNISRNYESNFGNCVQISSLWYAFQLLNVHIATLEFFLFLIFMLQMLFSFSFLEVFFG